MKFWNRLAKGHYTDLGDVTIDDVDLESIEVSLNQIKRFNGHHKDKEPLTVAQHTHLCCVLATELYGDERVFRACALHDFHEAFVGDITSPVKHFIGRDRVKALTDPIDKLIYQKFWYSDEEKPSKEVKEAVTVCDLLSLDIERRNMWKSQVGKDKWPPVPENYYSLMDKQLLFDEAASIKYVKLGDYLQ